MISSLTIVVITRKDTKTKKFYIDRGNVVSIWYNTLQRMIMMDLIEEEYELYTDKTDTICYTLIKRYGIGTFNTLRKRVKELGV